MRIANIINEIEKFAPRSLQEKWDNTGLQVGDPTADCTGVLVCFDVTPAVVEEAIALNCNLIVSHHPLFFKPVRRLTADTPQQVCAINAITAGITIYSSHTAIDSARQGVSHAMAHLLGVKPTRVLAPLTDRLVLMRVNVPKSHAEMVRAALFDAGAGAIGNYDSCSFNIKGDGTFRALKGANPYVGEVDEPHTEAETQIEVVVEASAVNRVERAMLEVHPYETPAYSFVPMLNKLNEYGLGVYGILDDELSAKQFVEHVKKALNAPVVRTTPLPDHDIKIRRVAMCGGAGAEFIETAIAMGAQAYITADIKYHDFVDYQQRILLIDAGHYETEAAVKHVIADVITKAFGDLVKVYLTNINDNPINYL